MDSQIRENAAIKTPEVIPCILENKLGLKVVLLIWKTRNGRISQNKIRTFSVCSTEGLDSKI